MSATFPHPLYAQHVLRPSFEVSRRWLFSPMLLAHEAHVVMLTEREIIPQEAGRILLRAIEHVRAEGPEGFTYQEGIEDLFFAVEHRLAELAGWEIAGNLQIARSRNDLGAALQRMIHRQRLLDLGQALLTLRETILGLARRHSATLMAGHTHYQPAQPTTLGHYFAGIGSALERDTERLHHAYSVANQSPLGCAAFTTTGFPIDRQRLAELLGFDGVLLNGQDAIGAADYVLESATSIAILASNLSRLIRDLLFWATRESGAIQIADAFIQISSIMPQKRNPVVLEHLRARLGHVYGYAHALLTLAHNVPYGDTQDIEDEMLFIAIHLFDTAIGVLELLTAVLDSLKVNAHQLREHAADGFTTATELADTLVREFRVPFRMAHTVVARLVKQASAAGLSPSQVTPEMLDDAAMDVLGRALRMPPEQLRQALDPAHFVEVRGIDGGTAPESMARAVEQQTLRLAADRQWLNDRRRLLDDARQSLTERVQALCRPGEG